MAFLEIQFPNFESIPLPARGGPMFNTGVITAASGFEQRNQWWSIPRRKWDIAVSNVDEETKDIYLAFFMNAAGKANGFRKRDWTDYQMTLSAIEESANGTDTEFQLKKTYTIGGQAVSIDIKKPVTSDVVDYDDTPAADTVHIFFGSSEQLSGWGVDHTTGIVTFDSPPPGGTVINATCDFDIPVRFDTDALEFTLIENRLNGVGGIYTCASIPLLEIRV